MPKEKKKKYRKPEIKKIHLDAKAAVLGFCKTTTSDGPHPLYGCQTPTPPCTPIGS